MRIPELKTWRELLRALSLAIVMMGFAIWGTVWWLGDVASLTTTETIVPVVIGLVVAHMIILIALFKRHWFDALLNVGYAVPAWMRFSVISATVALYALNSVIWTELVMRTWTALIRMANNGFFQTLIVDHWGTLLMGAGAALILLVTRAGRNKVTA